MHYCTLVYPRGARDARPPFGPISCSFKAKLSIRVSWCTPLGVDPLSLRFRLRYLSQIQIWTPVIVKSRVSYTNGHQQFKLSLVSNPVMQSRSTLSVIVFILVFFGGHPRFDYYGCPDLNLRQISQSQSEALVTHALGLAPTHPSAIFRKSWIHHCCGSQ